MEIRKASVSDMFGWLIGSFKLVGKHWGTFMLAALVSLAALFLLAFAAGLVIGLSAAGGAMGDVESINWQKIALLYAVILLVALILVPPFIAGWFVLTGKLADGQSASVGDLFSGYGDGARWKKLIAFGLIGAVLNVAVQGGYILICMALGVGSDDIGQFMSAQLSNDPEAMAGLSAGFWAAYAGIILIGSVLQTAFMLGFCQAALTDTGAMDSVKDGFAATLKNLGSLLLFMLTMLLVVIVAALVIGLVAGLLIAALSMLNSSIALALGAVLYILLLLFIYPLMFSFQYLFWRDVLGGGNKAAVVSDSEVLI